MTPEELYLANEKLVHYVLNKHFFHKQFDEDYKQIARIGLWKACLKYNPDISSFSSFACQCIMNEIKMDTRKTSSSCRNDSDYIFMSLDQPIKSLDASDATVSDLVVGESNEGFLDLEGYWKCLTQKEKSVIVGLIDGKNQTQIAKDMGVSRAYVSRLVGRIRKKWSDYI